MSNRNKYIFNTETLSYEIYRESTRDKVKSVAGVMLLGLALFLGYVFYYTKSLKTESLKTVLLEKRNRDLLSRIGLLDQKLDRQGDALSRLQMRDNNIYRPVFGMDEIPASVRNAGFGGIDRYASLAQYQNAGLLTSVAMKLDIIQKKTVIQSRSLDEVEFLSQRSGEMASCIPAVSPVELGPRIKLSSYFGVRMDPVHGGVASHKGIDLSGPTGEPIYASGDGVVASVRYLYYGYGNMVEIDHGFGYITRYAHLNKATVVEGQKIKRGQKIGEMGRSGKATGVHLHYEVLYKARSVNPQKYLTMDLKPGEYQAMVKAALKK